MSNMNQRTSGHSHKFAVILIAVSIVVTALLLINRQFVVDQISVWQYQPSSEITALADKSGMNEQGKFYFYTGQPALVSTQDFNNKCDRKEQTTAILGCYNGRYIYLYDVKDVRLDGIREVTAAHEMLHAAYDRLGPDDRKRVNNLLEAEYTKLKSNEKMAERMAFYARTEPGERENELHSIIGTEVASVSSELEAHYRKFFTDRSRSVALHSKYESVFSELQQRGESLSKQLTQLADSIESDSVDYNKAVTQLNNDIDRFNDRANNGGFSSQSEFTNTRSELVGRADQLEVMRASINSMVKEYEALHQELLSIASQSEALNRSIDSSLAPAPSL